MLMVYNNSGLVVYCMTQKESMTVKSEEEKKVPKQQTLFPRIIREFYDGADEEPMAYGRYYE